MVALTKDRDTRSRAGFRREPPVKAGARIFAGAMVAIDATNFAVPAATATGLKVLGRAARAVDNSTGANGAQRVVTEGGIYCYANSAGADEITLQDIGNACYAVDDQTVARTSGSNTRSPAGVVFDVDDAGVWTKFS